MIMEAVDVSFSGDRVEGGGKNHGGLRTNPEEP
jgi:hypothetical protein